MATYEELIRWQAALQKIEDKLREIAADILGADPDLEFLADALREVITEIEKTSKRSGGAS